MALAKYAEDIRIRQEEDLALWHDEQQRRQAAQSNYVHMTVIRTPPRPTQIRNDGWWTPSEPKCERPHICGPYSVNWWCR